MKSFRIITTGLSATMLATTMLAGAASAAPKPKFNFGAKMVAPPKPVANIVKPVRPQILRPGVKVRVNRDVLERKPDQDDGAGQNAHRNVQPRNRVVAALTPPSRLPAAAA